MPFDPASIPPRLVDAARNRTLIPLVGAGLSAQAGPEYPGWSGLLLDMRDRAVHAGHLSGDEGVEVATLMGRGNYLMAAQALKHSLPLDEYLSFLQDKFDPSGVHPMEVHRELFRLRAPMYITTNYDRLLENAYAWEYGEAAGVVTYKNPVLAHKGLLEGRQATRPLIFKTHGTIDDPDGVTLWGGDSPNLFPSTPGSRLVLPAVFPP